MLEGLLASARIIELESILSDLKHHDRQARRIQAGFDDGTRKDFASAVDLQRHQNALKTLRKRLPKPRLVTP